MNSKFLGYIAILIGLVGIFVSSKKIMDILIAKMPFLDGSGKYILIAGLILVAVGVVFVMSNKESKYKHKTGLGEEVPIFKGKDIVGYRIKK